MTVVMSSTDVGKKAATPEATKKEETPKESKPADLLDPKKADQAAATEFKSKYGFAKAPSTMAQRKISATGGKQYFDSGDYNRSKSRHDRQEIASHPHAMDPRAVKAVNPHLAHIKRGANISRTPRSKLTGKSPLAG